MKRLTAVVCMFASMSLYAQPKLSIFKSSNSIKPDLEKVVHDYFDNFDNIKGDTISQNASIIEFTSKVVPPGALDASITKYKTPKTYSWQSTMFKSEEFKDAVAKYKQYFRQLNGATFVFADETSYRLAGQYDAPDEERAFASSVLETSSYDRSMKLFKIEIGLNFTFPEWAVKIMVYEKIADEDIRPSTNYTR